MNKVYQADGSETRKQSKEPGHIFYLIIFAVWLLIFECLRVPIPWEEYRSTTHCHNVFWKGQHIKHQLLEHLAFVVPETCVIQL